MSDHLPFDELAELDEGLLPPERASAARMHLADCEQCRYRAQTITSAQAHLASLPNEQMPADVAARLDRALAAEAADSHRSGPLPFAGGTSDDSADSTDDTPQDSGRQTSREPTGTVMPAPGTVSRPRFGRPTLAMSSAAAAVVLIIAAVIVGHSLHKSPSGSTASAASAPGVAATVPRAASPSSPLVQVSTNLVYTPQNLASNVRRLLADTPGTSLQVPSDTASATGGSGAQGSGTQSSNAPTGGSTSPPLPSAKAPAALSGLESSKSALLQCAASVTATSGAVPVVVDFGRWTDPAQKLAKSPSAIMVFKTSKPSEVAAWVVSATCDPNAIRIYQKVALQP